MSFMSFMSSISAKSTKSADPPRPNRSSFASHRSGPPSLSPAVPDPTHLGLNLDLDLDLDLDRAPAGFNNYLGGLPALGVSDRGYLASLVSLFSTGQEHETGSSHHSPLSSALTALTVPSIIEDATTAITTATSLGLYEYDVHSSAVCVHAQDPRLYTGRPDIIHPPPEALLEFELETLPRLERDLQAVAAHFGQRGIRLTYELRMSGLATIAAVGPKGDTTVTGPATVTLAPTVWILYRSYSAVGDLATTCHQALQQAVAQLPYLEDRPVQIREGGGRIELAGDRRLVNVDMARDDDRIRLSGGGALSVHVQAPGDSRSVCGALCSVTIDEEDDDNGNDNDNSKNNDNKGGRQTQSLCRIGGLLLVNGKYVLGVTTAHAILDSSHVFKDAFDNAAEPRSVLGKAVDRDVIVAEVHAAAAAAAAAAKPTWHNVTRDAAVDFLGVSMNSRGEMAIHRSTSSATTADKNTEHEHELAHATDFALLRLRQTPGEIRNEYTPPGADQPVAITSSASARAASLDEGPVYILAGGATQVTDGQLVWGSVCYVVRGRHFHLRRVQTSQPLSKSLLFFLLHLLL